ncbi:MAG: hypothetical protein MUF38_01455 [Anaerolineae bacterium]|nr:hypothetical protein [Anaerolineae bacterium]
MSNVRITGVRFYGNGSNPFPSNECTPSATATPSATSAPSGTATPVSLTLDTNGLFSQTNGWISVFVPLFALFVVVPVAVAILMFIGRAIIQALRGGR